MAVHAAAEPLAAAASLRHVPAMPPLAQPSFTVDGNRLTLLPDGPDDREIVRRAAEFGVTARALSE